MPKPIFSAGTGSVWPMARISRSHFTAASLLASVAGSKADQRASAWVRKKTTLN